MSAVLDLPAVRRFTDDLRDDAARCGNGEGMECSSLDARIKHFADLCWKLREAVREWALSVFKGRSSLDPEAETLYRTAIISLAARARAVAEEVAANQDECYQFEWYEWLLSNVQHLEFLDAHWRTPQLAVAPGPRVPLSEAAVAEGLKVLAQMPGLPADWEPSDPEQRERLRRIRAANAKQSG